MQVALLRRAVAAASGRWLGVSPPRRERAEDRVEVLDDLALAADHQAVTALETQHPAAHAGIDVVNALARELPGAPDVVDVIRIAAVDHDVARREQRRERVERPVHDRRRNHQPNGAGRRQAAHEILERRGAGRAFRFQLIHVGVIFVEPNALVPAAH